MRSLITSFVLLVGFTAPGWLAHAQGTDPASKSDASASVTATKAEVDQLRSEVAAQRQTIDELKALVEKLVAARAPDSGSTQVQPAQVRPVADAVPAGTNSQPVDAPSTGTAHLVNAVLTNADPAPAPVVDQAPPAAAPKKDA